MSNASIIEGRCTICDRATDNEKSQGFQLKMAGKDTGQQANQLTLVEGAGGLCILPGSIACLGRAVDWRARYKATVNQMMELANDTLVSVAKMARDHQAQLDIAHAEGRKSAAAISPLGRSWEDGVLDTISMMAERRNALLAMENVSPAALMMMENILQDLRTMLARGKREAE